MSVALASTWNPHGELPRLRRLLPFLQQIYPTMVVSLPAEAGTAEVSFLQIEPWAHLLIDSDWSSGVYAAVTESLAVDYNHLHYVDMDRLLRWAETRPRELEQTVSMLTRTDCLIIGRTEQANHTHPRCMQETEGLANLVASHRLGLAADVCAGSRGFSRRAVECLRQHSRPSRLKDAEWPLLLQRAGFRVDYLAVDGLDWETADRYRSRAADAEAQRQAAVAYDEEVANWQARVQVAREIIENCLSVP